MYCLPICDGNVDGAVSDEEESNYFESIKRHSGQCNNKPQQKVLYKKLEATLFSLCNLKLT